MGYLEFSEGFYERQGAKKRDWEQVDDNCLISYEECHEHLGDCQQYSNPVEKIPTPEERVEDHIRIAKLILELYQEGEDVWEFMITASGECLELAKSVSPDKISGLVELLLQMPLDEARKSQLRALRQ